MSNSTKIGIMEEQVAQIVPFFAEEIVYNWIIIQIVYKIYW